MNNKQTKTDLQRTERIWDTVKKHLTSCEESDKPAKFVGNKMSKYKFPCKGYGSKWSNWKFNKLS